MLNTDDFKSLVTSNDMVNMTVKEFVGRLDVVKEEIQKYEAMKYDFWLPLAHWLIFYLPLIFT